MSLILSHYNALAECSQWQPTVYNFHMSWWWCQRNWVGPMKCVQFSEAIVKLSVAVTGVRGLQMQCW